MGEHEITSAVLSARETFNTFECCMIEESCYRCPLDNREITMPVRIRADDKKGERIACREMMRASVQYWLQTAAEGAEHERKS